MILMILKVQGNLTHVSGGPAGDPGIINDWHEDFLNFERRLSHLSTQTGKTGSTRIIPQDNTPPDFFKLVFNHVLLEMLIEQTDTHAKLQKENHPDENKMAWVRPSIREMNAFFGLCFEIGIHRKPSTRMYCSTDSFLQSLIYAKNHESGSLYTDNAVSPFF